VRISQYNNINIFVQIRIFVVLFLRKESSLLFVFFFTFFTGACASSIAPAYELFLRFEKVGQLDHEDSIEEVFKAFESNDLITRKEIARAVHAEVKAVYSEMKKTHSKSDQFGAILQKRKGLKRFRSHIKKHRHLYEFLGYSRLLEQRYKYAFGNKYLVEDVYQHPDRYEYSRKKGDMLVKFLKLLLVDLGKIDRFETKLHSCYGRLKAWNYSFKIECIKLRNEILLHPWYKYRLRPGYEFFADCVSPLTYMGKVLFHVVPSVFCLTYFTLSTSLDGSGPNQD
jgi:hypothetical protein